MVKTKDIKKIPDLRFSEFEGEWKDTTLGSLTTNAAYGMNSAAINFDGENQYLRITDIDDESRCFKPDPLTTPNGELEDKYILKKGDIVFARTGASVGKSYLYNETDGKLYFAGFLIKFSIDKADAYFVYTYTFTRNFWKWIRVMSMRSGQPGVNSEEYKTLKIATPTMPEQEKIASFLSAVDKKIQQLTAKKELLEQYKKGVMQKIFSQEIRFTDENGKDYPDWQEKRLGEVGVFKSGTGFTEKEQGGKTGTPFFKVSDMNTPGNEFHMSVSQNYVDDIQIKRLKFKPIVDKSLIFAKVGAAIFLERKRIAKHFLIDNNMMAFTPNGDVLFFKYVFDTIRLSKYAQIGALPSYNGSDMASIKVAIPSNREQQKIASFLSSIDKKIASVQNQLNQTQIFKKGLLQQLFV